MFSKLLNLAIVVLLAVALLSCGGRVEDRASRLNSLVEAERAFAAYAEANSTKQAFLKFLTSEAVVFEPQVVNAHQVWSDRAESDRLLAWQPAYADIAITGDFGYTTGPWGFYTDRSRREGSVFGHYVTVWKVQPDSSWRVELDIGISHGEPEFDTAVKLGAAVDFDSQTDDYQFNIDKLLSTDRLYSSHSEQEGVVAAFAMFAADDVRLYRDGNFPQLGKEQSLALLGEEAGNTRWEPSKADVSLAADLGYTYGIAYKLNESGVVSSERYSYAKIWRRKPGGDWALVLDVAISLPTDTQ